MRQIRRAWARARAWGNRAESSGWARIAGVALLMALTFTAVAVQYLRALEDRAVATAGEQLAAIAATVADDIDGLLVAHSRTLDGVARDLATTGITVPAATRLFATAREGRPDVEIFGVVDWTGRVVVATDMAAQGLELADRTWFAAARDAGAARLFGPHLSELTGPELTVGLSAPIRGVDGTFRGVVFGEVSLSALLYRVRQRVRVISDGDGRMPALEWTLLDRDGLIIAESDLAEQGRVNLLEHGVASAEIASTGPAARRWIEEPHGRLDGMMITGFADAGRARATGLLPWRVLVRMQTRDVLGPMRALLARIVGAGALVLVPLLIVLARLLAQRRQAERALRRAQTLLEERITERTRELREVVAALERARNEALAAARAKSAFLANMSHEIRTPITAILGYGELLADSRPSPRLRQEYVETIRRNGEHLLGIINDILDLSKLEAGKMTVEEVVCSPAHLVREVEAMLGGRAAGKGLRFDFEIGAAVPAAVRTDPRRIRQILVNLVGNAIKFTEAGGVRVAVVVAGDAPAGRARLRFTVADTGIGMTDEERARVFAPFAQADASTTRRFGGTGLGLAISTRLAEVLGGALSAESAPGMGSVFALTLDVELAPDDARPALETPLGPDAAGDRSPRLRARVLLAEDAPDSQRLLALFLRKAGAEVEVVENGRLACDRVLDALASARPFDLVVMDMQMPVMDGYEATACLRRRGVRTPIIALTAHSMDGDRDRCLEAGCTDYLAKPIDRVQFLRRLREHLDAVREPSPATAPPVPARRFGDADPEMRELLATFVAGLAHRAEAIESSLEARDVDRLATLAHQLKGTARAYGFPQLTDEAASLEASLRAGLCLDDVRAQVHCVVELCRAAGCQ